MDEISSLMFGMLFPAKWQSVLNISLRLHEMYSCGKYVKDMRQNGNLDVGFRTEQMAFFLFGGRQNQIHAGNVEKFDVAVGRDDVAQAVIAVIVVIGRDLDLAVRLDPAQPGRVVYYFAVQGVGAHVRQIFERYFGP